MAEFLRRTSANGCFCINLTHLIKKSSNKSEFYTSKTYPFSLKQAVKKKQTLPNILAMSAAGMLVDGETNSLPSFQGFLYDKVLKMRLNTSVFP